MAVLPPYSSHALPEAYRDLMFNTDSEIIDFYPDTFKVDLVGKRHAWLGEVLLPMIDEIRLKKALDSRKEKLNKEEVKRNRRGTYLFFRNSNHFEKTDLVNENNFQEIRGDFKAVSIAEHIGDLPSNEGSSELDGVQLYEYTVPEYFGHKCNLLEGVKMPPRYLPSNVNISPT